MFRSFRLEAGTEKPRGGRTIHRNRGDTVADSTTLTDTERAKLEQRRDRLMKLIKDGGSDLEADDRSDLMQEWTKIDNLLTRR